VTARIVFADCETISIDPGPATIWELALIERNPAYSGDEENLWHIRPDVPSGNAGSLAVGGYYRRCKVRAHAPGSVLRVPLSPDQETEHLGSPQLAGQLAAILDGAHLIAANPQFDAGHMDAFLRANGECLTADYHYTDLGSLVRGYAVAHGMTLPWPLKVADAARIVGLRPEDCEAHTALGDVRMGRDIFDRVMAGA
jgi:hypothetical protein